MTQGAAEKAGWGNRISYQIYPATFNEQHGRNNGVGSIRGITEKLDYLKQLGVGVIWVSPFFESPMIDGGYDISDHMAVNPELGTIEDFKQMAYEAHQRDIKVMIDLIPNHTSDQHDWFQQSRSPIDNPKTNWYIWHDGKIDKNGNRQPPNNWASVFSLPQLEARRRGEMPELAPDDKTPPLSAWTWDKTRGQYYLHSFAKEQPDLNMDNPAVRQAIKQIMRHWLDLGVDCFRVDAVNYIGKNWDLLDEELNTAYQEGVDNPYDQLLRFNSCGYPRTFYKYMREFNQVLRETRYIDYGRRAIYEAYMPEDELLKINSLDPDVASAFNFGTIGVGWQGHSLLRKKLTDIYYKRLPKGAIANNVLGNHDKQRIADRLDGEDQDPSGLGKGYGVEKARAAAIWSILLPGNTFIYNGEELGLTDHKSIPTAMIKDPNGLRDPNRTPMLWDSQQPNFGFSEASADKLYLPLNSADADKALDLQCDDPLSTWSLYRAAIALKNFIDPDSYIAHRVLAEYSQVEHLEVTGYEIRGAEARRALVLINFSHELQVVKVQDIKDGTGSKVLSSIDVETNQAEVDFAEGLSLWPLEAAVIKY